jgi:penicillin-binding protein 1A
MLLDTSVNDETTQIQVALHRDEPPKKRWLRRIAVGFLLAIVVGAIAAVVLIAVLSRDLPQINSLADYKPKQSTVVYGGRGQVVARFASERRTLVDYDRIPRSMVDAVVASEDSEFFNHEGLDYTGMLRCAVKNFFALRIACGASTITQQTVKTFLLSPKQTMGRKLREMILAKRVEEALTKDEILYLYLNQIYFGHGAYGVQEAAHVFFGKDVSRLSLEEAALLAGLPQSPVRLDPYRYPDRALARRAYVLGRLRATGKIDEAAFKIAADAPLKLDWNQAEQDLDSSNHYASHVRGMLEAMFGKERATDGGLKVYTGLDPEMQREAERALREGLRSLDKRQGWRGPLMHLELDRVNALRSLLDARREKLSSGNSVTSTTAGPVIWDLRALRPQTEGSADIEALAEEARFPRFEMEKIYGGLVTKVDDAGKEALVDLGGGTEVHLPLRTGLSWARKFDITRGTKAPRAPSDVLSVGDVVLVRATTMRKSEIVGILEQTPKAESALVAIEPSSREVRAMVGGYGVGAGMFNRAVQARRQAGSTFKPFVYAAAFETGSYTPITLCLDAPRVYRDPWTGRSWKPENYGGTFDGEITLREALTNSKNLCSVELIDRLGVEHVLDVAKRSGIESPMPRNLTVALGSGDVTPLEMVNSYATIASGGVYSEPVFITKVLAPDDTLMFEAVREEKQALRAEIAYQVTSLMQSVVESGTAQRVRSLERPVAGKTGTSNEARNAWFVGFTPDLVAGVWVGFDNNDPLGPQETGGRAAIPIWLELMHKAVEKTPVHDFVAPSGIVFAHVDPKHGKLASPDDPAARLETFISGTEPTGMPDVAKPPDNFGLDDYE